MKTRLAPAVGTGGAARLYECMLLDVLERTAAVPAIRFFYHSADVDAAGYFGSIAPEVRRAEQAEGDLGIRMEKAFEEVLASGVSGAAIIGTDSPDLPLEYVEEAYRLLDDGNDAVFGPTEDGGYYLAAMKQVHPELFREIPWSSQETLATTLRQAEQAEIKVALLPPWYDVDEPSDLSRKALLKEDCPARRTREFLCSLHSQEEAGF